MFRSDAFARPSWPRAEGSCVRAERTCIPWLVLYSVDRIVLRRLPTGCRFAIDFGRDLLEQH